MNQWQLAVVVVAVSLLGFISTATGAARTALGQPLMVHYMPGGSPDTPFEHCTPTSGAIAENVFGLQMWGPLHTHPKTLNAIDDLGVKWVYNIFHWPTVEAGKDIYNTAPYDDFLLEMARRGINPLMSVGNYWPMWITGTGQLKDEFYELVRLLAARYKPGGTFAQEHHLGDFGVRYWEVINEPNYPCCGWGSLGENQPVDTALYAELLGAANKALREEDPNAIIVHGGLSSSNEYFPPTRFLGEMYARGAGDCFDVLAYHPYGQHRDFAGALAPIRDVMARNGDAAKPVWFTELGEPLLRPAATDKDTQSEVFGYSTAQISVVSGFFWFNLHDFSPTETWGLLDYSLEPREPIYSAVKRYIRESER